MKRLTTQGYTKALSREASMSVRNIVRRIIGRPVAPKQEADDAVFRAMVEQSGDVICHLVDRLFTYVSPSARAIFGWDPDAMIGTDGTNLIYEPDLPVLQDVLARSSSGELGSIRHQVRVVCGDGSLKWAETSAQNQLGAMNKMHTILVIRDVSERKRLEEQLEDLARKDGLTGLANRRSFDEMLVKTWRQTLRQGSEMALLLLDIDHFKQFNDLYGHQAGDDCLRTVAAAVAVFARRPDDLACRYGGEEFAIVLGGVAPDVAVGLAEEVRSAIASLRVPHERSSGGFLTVSIGVATAVARIGGSVRMPESLLQAADHALYKAKAGGRDRVERTVLIAPSDQT
jgi:diguanylate cyclase (GGDEF)-like protein/PAS domain S-box-containing protein